MAALGVGTRGYKDFGLSTNLTLPIANSSIEPDPKVMAQNAYMPEEGYKESKKHARFALDQSGEKVHRAIVAGCSRSVENYSHDLRGLHKKLVSLY
jgi:hypothetical protein